MTTESVPKAPHPRPGSQPESRPVAATVARLRKTFATGRTRSIEWRKQQLLAAGEDDGRERGGDRRRARRRPGPQPVRGFLADVATTPAEAKYAAKRVRKWTRRKYRLLELPQLPGRGWVEYEPYGTVLIIGAWNYPFYLTLGPGGRGDRRRKHRGAQALGDRRGIVAADGRAGARAISTATRSRWSRATAWSARS